MEYWNAFLVGGLLCSIAQFLMEKTKLMPGRIMVIYVCSGVILGGLQLYEPLVDFAGSGAMVPLTGFGYNLWKGVKEAVDSDGLLGIFRGGLKMAAVGTTAALVFSYIASWIFQPKMTK